MNGYADAVRLLPHTLHAPLLAVEPSICCRVQELRLRAGQAVALGVGGEEWFVKDNGEVTAHRAYGIRCEEALLRQTIDRMVDYSAYAHQEELRRGFVTVNGCRVGIAGTAVVDHDGVRGFHTVRGLCIRVVRTHIGVAETLLPLLCVTRVHSALIGSEPGGGKTSLLRDVAVQLSQRRYPVAVIDERGELFADTASTACDVLSYMPKAEGIELAVRCLAPRAVLLDELGDASELAAVRDALLRGVPTIATVHTLGMDDLYRRSEMRKLLRCGAFEYVIVLRGRHAPGQIAQVIHTKEWLCERTRGNSGTADGRVYRGDGAAYLDASRGDAVVT